MRLDEIKEIAKNRHVWEEDSTQRSVAGEFYDTVCDALDEALLFIDQLGDKYNELVMAVVNKHPNETRHETALRYIQAHERRISGPSEVSNEP